MGIIASLISWTIFGLIAGAIARYLVPGRQPMSLLQTFALGVVGSLAGGFVAWLLAGGFPIQSSGLILSVIGATAILAYRVHRNKNSIADIRVG